MEPDPRARFVDQLKQLRVQAGNPTLADLETQDPAWLNQKTVSDLLHGKFARVPPWERVSAFVTACVRIGKAKKRVMPPDEILLEQWRHRHEFLAVALEQVPPRNRGAPADNGTPEVGRVGLGHGGGSDPGSARGGGRRRFGAVPPRAGAFQQRLAARALADTAAGGGTTVLIGTGSAQVLTGLGGVGKTQLAADHAHTQWDHGRVRLLVWISARSRVAITSAYTEVAVELLGQDPATPERAWRRLLEWLAETTDPWLVVLDDLQDPSHLTGLWPPHTPCGQVVVTTRRRDAALHSYQRHVVEVGLFAPEQALAYLTERLPERGPVTTELAGLAGDLGHLPLALAQAAAYLANKPMLTTAAYRARLADRRTKLPDVLPREPHLPDEHERTVAATWSLSIEAADELDPAGLARPALELASLLDPAGIPTAVFTTRAFTNHLTARFNRDVTGDDVLDGLECLRRFSLITLHPEQPHHAVRVHALVQRAVRDPLTTGHLAELARTAADALVLVWPEIETNQELAQALRSNVTTLQSIAEEHLWRAGGHPVLFRLARSLGDAGLLDSAVAVNHRLLAQASARLGPDHADTLTIRYNLARLRGEAGDPAGAAAAYAELLADQLRALGPEHPHTLAVRANLARWRGEAGDPAGAATALAELLPDRLRILGPDHLYTLATRHSLAYWRGEAGDPAGAATALAELLPDQLRVLGPEHPHTLAVRASLARWRGEAGDPAGAAAVFAELLPDRLRVLGPDHLYMLITRHALAYWRGEAGDRAGAAAALTELLSDQLRILGPDHPHTLHTRGNLARFRGEAGDPAGAAAALTQLLSDQLRVLGQDHPHTLRSWNNLAAAYLATGDVRQAIALYETALAGRDRVLGADHLDTLATRNSLAGAYLAAEDREQARRLYETTLADAERVLAPDHPLTKAIRANLNTIKDQSKS
ncbi:tetratricopeptide repeat protein [Amycolatopsis sacchari]|uniref:tetratricopeptide repeat protein n=1 Tax=Amycolatopsis sacchari TaxID=115433 RepID=UPI003D72F7CC